LTEHKTKNMNMILKDLASVNNRIPKGQSKIDNSEKLTT